jgi:Ca2+-binding EF-hand superfamily protein
MSSTQEHDIQAHFRFVDRDGNGLIDFEEFRLMLHKMGANRRSDVMTHAFKAIDTNNSGQIDLHEFSAWWSRQQDPSVEGQLPSTEDSPEP